MRRLPRRPRRVLRGIQLGLPSGNRVRFWRVPQVVGNGASSIQAPEPDRWAQLREGLVGEPRFPRQPTLRPARLRQWPSRQPIQRGTSGAGLAFAQNEVVVVRASLHLLPPRRSARQRSLTGLPGCRAFRRASPRNLPPPDLHPGIRSRRNVGIDMGQRLGGGQGVSGVPSLTP